MLEPLFGLAVCLSVYLAVWFGSKVTSEFTRDRAFERWCASQPMILAFRCRGDVDDAQYAVRALLAPYGELVNLHGGAPWQYYRFDVVVRASDSVVSVHIVDAIPQRGPWTRRCDASEIARRVASSKRADVEEIWLHGQLQPSEARSETRDQRSWLARVEDDGVLAIHPMIGRPRWVDEAA